MSKKNDQQGQFQRRTLLKMGALGASSIVINSCASSKKGDGIEIESVNNGNGQSGKVFRPTSVLEDDGPIDRNFGDLAPLKFSGEDPERTHQILWDIPSVISGIGGKVPDPSEITPIVIIGGGMSGLMSAYQMKKYVPIVLESADRFGGNSRGESWRGIDYSIGAAYLCAPKEGSNLDQFYRDLDLYRRMKVAPDDEPVILNGKIIKHFLKGDSDSTVAVQAAELEKYFSDVLGNKNGQVFPALPPENETQRKAVMELDRLSFRDHIKKVLITDTIHPYLDTWLEHYCWSVFGASCRELSAAIGVNQFAGEFGKLWVPPGGNAFVAEQLLSKLKKDIGNDRLRARSIVFQVKSVDDGVWVTYERDGQVKTILAEAVVFACPKYVVRKVFHDLEPEREKAIRRIRYNSYLVANVLLNQKVPDGFYDMYLLADGKLDPKDVQGTAERHRATDIINGTYVKGDGKDGILTLYRGFPYLAGKAQVYSSGAYFKYRKEFIDQVENEILPVLGVPKSAISGIRLARWGHPLPVAQPGMIRSGMVEALHKPFKDKIYFINQDNWLNPCLEQAFGEAQKWSPQLIKVLEQRRLDKTKQSVGGGDSNSKKGSPAAAATASEVPSQKKTDVKSPETDDSKSKKETPNKSTKKKGG